MSLLNFQTIILALIQGVSEFIPISSSAHLVIFSDIFKNSESTVLVDTSLHLGSLIAIVHYFWNDLLNFTKNKTTLNLLIFGSLPLVVVGYLLHEYNLYNIVRNIELIAWSSLIFGILLFISDRFSESASFNNNLNFKNIIIIGFFQILALIPGASRSGVVISGSRFLNFNRFDAAKISFILSIPALLGASVLTFVDNIRNAGTLSLNIIIGVIFSYLFSYLTIKYFLIYIKNFSLNIFVIYRIILSMFLFYFIYF